MKVPWQKERSTGGETAVQLRGGGRSTFGRLESYVPLLDGETALYREVREAVKIPVIANGDIVTAEDAVRCQKRTGAELLMLGRTTFGDPWVFEQAQAALRGEAVPETPPLCDRVDTALRQFRLAAQDKGEYIACLEARKHFAWYLRGVAHSSYYKEKISAIRTAAEARAIISGIQRDLR